MPVPGCLHDTVVYLSAQPVCVCMLHSDASHTREHSVKAADWLAGKYAIGSKVWRAIGLLVVCQLPAMGRHYNRPPRSSNSAIDLWELRSN